MSVVQPTSEFHLIKGVPFDDNYEHQILFSSKENRDAYFAGLSVAHFTDFTYVRQDNVVRLPVLADSIYNCNYCMFKNVGYGDRWFFAFVTNIEYVNNTTSYVSIELDYFQTWFYDCQVNKCFVEREHVTDDTVGANTVDEGLFFGENIPMYFESKYFTNWLVVIYAKPSLFGQFVEDDRPIYKNWNQTYPLSFIWDGQDIDDLRNWMDARIFAGYEFMGMKMFPTEFQHDNDPISGSGSPTYYSLVTDQGHDALVRPDRFRAIAQDSSHDYVPVNNKLLCYPYCFLRVVTTEGTSKDLKWENTYWGQIGFTVYNNILNDVSCYIQPKSYFDGTVSKIDSIPITTFPDCTYSENKFLSQIPTMAISAALTGMASGAQMIQAGKSDVTPKLQKQTKKGQRKVQEGQEQLAKSSADAADIINSSLTTPYETNVAATGTNLALKYDKFGYEFYKMGIRPEYAKIIDDYFTRYGYKVNRNKVPNLWGRSSFNYVKTMNCAISGDIPNDAHRALRSMFDNGITLWHTTSIGSYTDNHIVS